MQRLKISYTISILGADVFYDYIHIDKIKEANAYANIIKLYLDIDDKFYFESYFEDYICKQEIEWV